MSNSPVIYPPTVPGSQRTGSGSAARLTARSILHVLGILLAAAGIFLGYKAGILGLALGVVLLIIALVTVVVTITRVARRRAHVGWLADPLQPGSRRFAAQFALSAPTFADFRTHWHNRRLRAAIAGSARSRTGSCVDLALWRDGTRWCS